MYKYRQVQCPKCKHKFLWLEGPTGNSYCLYRRIGKNEKLHNTTCPKCSLELVVPSDSIEGIDIKDKSVELYATVRGI